MIVYLATKTQFRADIRDFIKDPYVLEFLGPPPELSRTPDEEGNEHQAWFDRDSVFTA